MSAAGGKSSSKLFLSLRWKALIALSLLLLVVNASLAYLAYRQSSGQFEREQAQVRHQQDRQLRAMVAARFEEMSRLASLVPLMGPSPPLPSLEAQIAAAVEANGALLDVEWDIRSVHWLEPGAAARNIWPETAGPLLPELSRMLAQTPEARIDLLACRPECRQYVATPLLDDGRFAGALVLVRSLADALLAFSGLTGAEVAVMPRSVGAEAVDEAHGRPNGTFPAITHAERSLPVLRDALARARPAGGMLPVTLVQRQGAWYEVFQVPALAPGVDALIINDVTDAQSAIRKVTRFSVLIALAGLFLSEMLLLMLLRRPLARLRDIAAALPLLAENRYREIRGLLPPPRGPGRNLDEMDLMVETVGNLTDRMESLQRDREHAEARLVWLADHDPLTHLFNRRRFGEDFARVLDQALRYGHRGAVLFLDLDQFKDVNDISGHQVGDMLLQRVAEQLQALARSSDILARLGGDEFAWVLPESTPAGAVSTAERTQEAIRSISVTARGRRHQVSASIGIVMFPDQGEDTFHVMANADLAMYQAKEKGRGRWHLFSHEDQARERADARVLWREQISDALNHDRFEMVFQPIVSVRTGVVEHYEALLRMRDGQGGLVYPDRFIPVAEKTGQIQDIDHWVLGHSVALLGVNPGLRLSVNLSANAMDDPLLLPDVERLLSRHGVAPSRLTFEITETAAINGIVQATRLMRGIQALGCRFALDDFGSGYASYAYLRQLPVDDVKVDGAFIRNLTKNPEDRIFVKAITDMAHGMGKRVTAEFVEDAEILELLLELGVDFAQGYYFARPRALEHCDVPALTATH